MKIALCYIMCSQRVTQDPRMLGYKIVGKTFTYFASSFLMVCSLLPNHIKFISSEPDGMPRFTALAVILILMSGVFLVVEVLEIRTWKITREGHLYSVVTEAIFRTAMFLLTIVFVFGFWNDCWCTPPWQWQIGALAVFMAYINVLLLLKGIPVLGVPINMLLNIVITFLKLIYLPVLLIFSFAIPFYMLFVRDSDAVLVSFLHL